MEEESGVALGSTCASHIRGARIVEASIPPQMVDFLFGRDCAGSWPTDVVRRLRRIFELSADAVVVVELPEPWPIENWSGDLFFPANWPPDRLDDVAELCVTTGLPLVGLPSSGIVGDLLAEYDRTADVGAVFDRRSADLVDELQAFADELPKGDETTHDAIQTFRELITNCRCERYRTVQASAFSVVEHLYCLIERRDRVRSPHLTRRHLVEECGSITLGEMHAALVFHSLASSFAIYHPVKGNSVPTRLNRHASTHTVSGYQHSQRNALCALLLIANILGLIYPPIH